MKRYSVLLLLLFCIFLSSASFAQEPKLMLPIGHSLGVSTAVFSPDGKRIVTSSLDNSVKIWEVSTGLLLANLRGHSDTVTTAVYSPDGKKIVTACEDGTGKIWDANSTQLLADLKGHTGKVFYAEFSPDGRKIVTASEDHTAKIWDAETGKLLFDLKGHTLGLWWAHFSKDGKSFVTTSDDHLAKVWDTETGKFLFDLKGHTLEVREADFNPNAKKIVSCSGDSTAKIWDAETGTLLFDLTGHKGAISFSRFNPDGKTILTGSDDGTVKIWDAETGKLRVSLLGRKKEEEGEYRGYWSDIITGAQFSPDGKKILTVYVDSCIKIWDAVTGNLLKEIKRDYEYVNSASFSPDGKKIALALAYAHIEIWDIAAGKLLTDLKGNAKNTYGVSISKDGKRLLMSSQFGSSKLFDVFTGALVAVFKGNNDKNKDVYSNFSPDGKRVLTTSNENFASVYDAITGQLLYELRGHPKKIYADFSPDGKRIITYSQDGTGKIWNTETGKLIFSIKENRPVKWFSMSFNSDGKKIISSSKLDGIVSIWNAETGQLITEINTPKKYIINYRFNANEKKLLIITEDSIATVWNAENGTPLYILKEPGRKLQNGDFSPDGSRLLIRLSERIHNTVITKMWNAETGEYITELNQEGSAPDFFASPISFTKDGKRIFSGMADGSVKSWDAKSGELVKNFKGLKKKNNAELNGFVNQANDQFIITSDEGDIWFYDNESGELKRELKGHTFKVYNVKFFDEGKKIITQSSDYTVKIWDAQTNNLLLTYLTLDKDDYLVLDKNNHFDGTEAARKLLYFTCGTEVIELDQVKDQLWVPNLAERILKGETINAQKLSDLNICNLTPVVETIDQTALQYRFQITPRIGGLGATIVNVNGIEVKRYTPQQLIQQKGNYQLAIDKKELQKFFVSGKENSIVVKSLTAKNSISSRSVSINEKGAEKNNALPNLFAVVVGVSDYKGEELDLKFAAKDAVDIGNAIDASAKKLLNTDGKEHVFMYKIHTGVGRDKFPEKNSIKLVFTEIAGKAQPNDILLVFFAGHGVMESENNKFYFLTADASNTTVSGALKDVGISTDELTEWIRPQIMKAQKRILIFDACNSGQAIKEMISIGQKGQNFLAARGDDKSKQIKAVEKLNERSGLFILSASASDQKAYEMGKYNQGALTYSLLKAIKEEPDILEDRKYLNISRWFNAAEKTVGELSRETGARQQPQIVSTTNFNIGVVDEEVRDKIVLPFEKPMFTRSDFRNIDLRTDNLKLRALIDKELGEMSENNISSTIMYSPEYDGANVYAISGDYIVKGNEVIVSVILTKGGTDIKKSFEIKGPVNEIATFSKSIVASVIEWLNKK